MKKVEVLRKKYPRFVYESFDWKIEKKDLKISFDFRIESTEECPPCIYFKPKVIIKNVKKYQISKLGDRVVDNLVFNLGLIELLSYWKATCSPEILVKAGYLNDEQIKWWKNLIDRGMGQFFFENKINFKQQNFLKIKVAGNSYDRGNYQHLENQCYRFLKKLNGNKILVPVGGGKDSIVTLEILKNAKNELKKELSSFSLNPTDATKKIMKIGGCKNPTPNKSLRDYTGQVIVERKIDENLLNLNQQGFLNGHTPFSAYLAFLSVLGAVLFDFKYITFSNERSSNEGNVKYVLRTETKPGTRTKSRTRAELGSGPVPHRNEVSGAESLVRGIIINHQYSKSFDFEKRFRHYSKKYLAKDIEYFSFLRPLYEIQIAKLFSRYPKYFSVFLSCNEAYKTHSGTKKMTDLEGIPSRSYGARKWCCDCPKCLFVFAVLYPFLEKHQLIKIFKEDLFKKISLLPIMLELVGERNFKPFECVGTKKESLIAFYLSYRKYKENSPKKLPFLLKYFEEKILNSLPRRISSISERFLRGWLNQHNLPKEFETILYSAKKERHEQRAVKEAFEG